MNTHDHDHLDDDALVALRDDEYLDDQEHRAEHLASCDRCRVALAAAQNRAGRVSDALASLDEGWDVEAARERVRRRVTEASAEAAGATPLRRRGPAPSWGLRRAASVALLLAVGVSALPGSPVRDWLSSVVGGDLQTTLLPDDQPTAPTAESAASEDRTTGIRLGATSPLRVIVQGLAPGAEVRVRWVSGTEVAVLAPEGSRFTSSDGRVEARVPGGPVTVELPRSLVGATLEVGGRIYLRVTSDGPDPRVPVEEADDASILFRVPTP